MSKMMSAMIYNFDHNKDFLGKSVASTEEDGMITSKSTQGGKKMKVKTKSERKESKAFRKNRKNARGKQWV